MKQIVLVILMAFLSNFSYAQLSVRPIPKYLSENQKNTRSSFSRVMAIADTVSLPFWDDFSYDGQNPDSTFWLYGDDVLINSGEGINPPTLNVATFDGLNALGGPHSASDFVSEADSLVSKAIDLSKVAETKKPTVYFSFYWQKQGLGELPDGEDSLRLQFYKSDSTWVTVRRISGLESNVSKTTFTQEHIQLSDDSYFHQGFRFRFQSFGKTTGPFDVWHLDYIYLNQDRTAANESIFDHAISKEPASFFNTYTNIPYDQLFALPDSMFLPYAVDITSQERNPHPVEYLFTITDSIANQEIFRENDNSTPLMAFDDTVRVSTIKTDTIRKINFNPNTDSLILKTEFQFITGDKFLIQSIQNGILDTTFLVSDSLNYRVNDTLRRTHVIHETLSYDDGSADFAAGINQINGQIAIEYTIAVQDTLTALDIYFPLIGASSGGQTIAFSVLKDLSGASSSLILRQENEQVKSSSKINEFVRYELNRPVLVSGTFFIVFEQARSEFIGIGLDKNNPQPEKIWSNAFGVWEQNNADNVNGSLMFRAIFGNTNAVILSSKDNAVLETIHVFPNPAKYEITVDGRFDSLELYSISGEKILSHSGSNQLDISMIQNGIYFLKINTRSGVVSKKLIVDH